jgi:hypothetical protein
LQHNFTTKIFKEYSFHRDNVPVIVLCQWNIEADYLDEDYMSGLMPVLFASDAESAEHGLRENVTSTMKDLDRLNRIFFSPETVDLDAAFAILKKP